MKVEINREQSMLICDALSTEIKLTELAIELLTEDSLTHNFLIRSLETMKELKDRLHTQEAL